MIVAVLFSVLAAAGTPPPVATPTAKTAGPPRVVDAQKIGSAAMRIFKAARYCTLATIGRDGQPQARIVDPLPPSAPRFEIYFATNPRSRKVAELRRDARTTLLCFDAASRTYAAFVGRAVRVPASEQSRYYKDDWKSFFDRDKPASYALYRLTPARIEVVSPPDGLTGDAATWTPDALKIR